MLPCGEVIMIGSGLMKGGGYLAHPAHTRDTEWLTVHLEKHRQKQTARKETNNCLSVLLYLFFFYNSALIQPFVILRSLETNIQPPPFAAQDEERFQLEGISINTPTHTHTNTCKHRQEQDHRDESDSRGKSLAGLSGPKLMRNNRILQARATASYY